MYLFYSLFWANTEVKENFFVGRSECISDGLWQWWMIIRIIKSIALRVLFMFHPEKDGFKLLMNHSHNAACLNRPHDEPRIGLCLNRWWTWCWKKYSLPKRRYFKTLETIDHVQIIMDAHCIEVVSMFSESFNDSYDHS